MYTTREKTNGLLSLVSSLYLTGLQDGGSPDYSQKDQIRLRKEETWLVAKRRGKRRRQSATHQSTAPCVWTRDSGWNKSHSMRVMRAGYHHLTTPPHQDSHSSSDSHLRRNIDKPRQGTGKRQMPFIGQKQTKVSSHTNKESNSFLSVPVIRTRNRTL